MRNADPLIPYEKLVFFLGDQGIHISYEMKVDPLIPQEFDVFFPRGLGDPH